MAIVTLKGFNQTCKRLSTKLFQEKDKAGNQRKKLGNKERKNLRLVQLGKDCVTVLL